MSAGTLSVRARNGNTNRMASQLIPPIIARARSLPVQERVQHSRRTRSPLIVERLAAEAFAIASSVLEASMFLLSTQRYTSLLVHRLPAHLLRQLRKPAQSRQQLSATNNTRSRTQRSW